MFGGVAVSALWPVHVESLPIYLVFVIFLRGFGTLDFSFGAGFACLWCSYLRCHGQSLLMHLLAWTPGSRILAVTVDVVL